MQSKSNSLRQLSLLTLMLGALIARPGLAIHFDFDTTDANCSILVRECYLMTGMWDEGDELGVFTSAGICGGGMVVEGFPLGIAAWADDALTDSLVEGFHSNDSILFVRWDASQEREIPLRQLYVLSGEPHWENNGLLIVELAEERPAFDIQPTFNRHRFICNGTDLFIWDIGYEPQLGDQVGIFRLDGQVCGLMTWGSPDSALGWAYQDDPATEAREGFDNGEAFYFIYHSDSADIDTVYWDLLFGSLVFEVDMTTIVRLWNFPDGVHTQELLPVKFEVEPAFPNPFNSSTRLNITLPGESPVRVAILSLDGREVLTLKPGSYPSGRQALSVDLSSLPSGHYTCRIVTAFGAKTLPLTLLR